MSGGAVVAGGARAAGLLLGLALDAALGDPRRGHPVAVYGSAVAAAERRWYRPTKRWGVSFVGVAVGLPCAAALLVGQAGRRRWAVEVLGTAVVTWAVVGGTSLGREGRAMRDLLAAGDLPGARRRITHLCGRDPSALDTAELARATIESVAENTSDAVVAPVFWGAVAGLPGLVGYRAVNTLDAMIGHRTTRYERFGWAAARLDDLVNLVPARLTATALVLTAGTVGGVPRQAAQVWRDDAAAHPSPNAGPVEAALAGSLGVRLGGTNSYQDRTEERGVLAAHGSAPDVDAIDRTVRACRNAAALACLLSVALPVVLGWARFRRRPA